MSPPLFLYYRCVLGGALWVIHQGKDLSPVSRYRMACHRYIPRCSHLRKRKIPPMDLSIDRLFQ